MSRTPLPVAKGSAPFATAAVDLHLALSPLAASRVELNILHAHLVFLHALLDAHARHTGRLASAQSNHLAAARHRIWQATDSLHTAYHSVPRGDMPPGEKHSPDLSKGASLLTICQRHQYATRLARRRMTPTDIARP